MTPDIPLTIAPVPTEPITAEQRRTIGQRFETLSPEEVKNRPAFCVDGGYGQTELTDPTTGAKTRQDIPVYPQLLGGSLNIVDVAWAWQTGETPYLNLMRQTFGDIRQLGYTVGLHTGNHGQFDEQTHECVGRSDCGAADNKRAIFQCLIDNQAEIWQMLLDATEGDVHDYLVNQNNRRLIWSRIIKNISKLPLDQLPENGGPIVNDPSNNGVAVQRLHRDHQEKLAVVNMRPGTTLNVQALNRDNLQAFNLDLWYLEEVLGELNKGKTNDEIIDLDYAKILTLGMYVATEMVLVEQKDKKRLEIDVRS